MVEHDEEAIRTADLVVDLGPGAGVHGGEIVAQGTAAEIAANPGSLTGRYLSGRPAHRHTAAAHSLQTRSVSSESWGPGVTT